MVDDPSLPCGYCVGTVPDDNEDSGVRLIRPDGSPVDRLYSRIHPGCQESVDAYMDELREERAKGMAW